MIQHLRDLYVRCRHDIRPSRSDTRLPPTFIPTERREPGDELTRNT